MIPRRRIQLRLDEEPFNGDSVAHELKWTGKSLEEFKVKVLRLEFQLHEADLYTFRSSFGPD